MKRLFILSFFLCASTWAMAQYNHVQVGPNGNTIEQGQYNADPGINPNDSKETIANKLAVVHKIGTWKYWYDNGQLSAEEHYDMSGNAIGIWKTWHNNGQVASEVNKTTGTAVYYYPNGQKSEEGTLNSSQERTGDWQGWHDNGQLNYKGSYTSSGQKNGTWKYYDPNGTITATEYYSNGVLSN